MKKDVKNLVSDSLLCLQQFFSTYAVAKYYADKQGGLFEAKKQQIKRKSIPSVCFRDFPDAWRNCKIKFPSANIDKAVENKLKGIIVSYSQDLISMYDHFSNLAYELLPTVAKDKYATQELSPLFSYRLNKCFNAICELEQEDVLFLGAYLIKSKENQTAIKEYVYSSKCISPQQTIESLTLGNGKNWLDARKYYSSVTGKKSDPIKNWGNFVDKAKEWAANLEWGNAASWKSHGARSIILGIFLGAIWPKGDATDTEFNTETIDLLICFKFFLTKDSQNAVLEQLGVPKNYPFVKA